MRRIGMGLSIAAVLAAQAMSASPPITFPEAPPEPGTGRTHGNGSQPVAGGGNRERQRRLARLKKAEGNNDAD